MERRYIFRRARPEDAGDIVRLYNSNPCFLERHLGCRAVDGTFVLQEWRQMKKEGFSTTVIADAQTGAAVGFIVVDDYEGNLVPFWKRRGFEEGEEITLEWGGKASRARVMYRDLI